MHEVSGKRKAPRGRGLLRVSTGGRAKVKRASALYRYIRNVVTRCHPRMVVTLYRT